MSAQGITEHEFAQRVLRMLNIELVRDQEHVARAQVLSQATVRGTAETHNLQQRGATPRPATISRPVVSTGQRRRLAGSAGRPGASLSPAGTPTSAAVVQGEHHPQPGS